MVKHVVLFKLIPFEEAAQKQAILVEIKTKLEALLTIIPELETIEVGLNANANESFDIALITTHRDFDGLKAYATHPEHVKVGQLIGQYKAERSCVDFEY